MSSIWEQVAVVEPDRLVILDEDTIELDGKDRYAVLPESGWGALVGWIAGSERLIGRVEAPSDHVTVLTAEHGQSISTLTRPRSREEQFMIDHDVNAYLQDAGAEARPSGKQWCLLLPAGLEAARLWEVLNEAVADAASHPSALAVPLRSALDELYRT